MHRTEESEHESCVVCRADVVPALDRAYAASDEDVLCFACAVRLGGVWDEAKATWTRAPDLRGVWVEHGAGA